ncbi:thioesterase domain-containing protein [Aquabacterium sp. A7-Y]|uniref:thioesterase domain-containing protein n=1 Tax=Aquabacterium sp. A7-Y TaxID=1349605 RepID=UPI00223D88EB|nr:thioesterase domain-containing protein [Aquabacterium sp. A7-Y]MCW7540954.1 thioesterase domain-containing protein [Aquabacterium sp. A7-Y]
MDTKHPSNQLSEFILQRFRMVTYRWSGSRPFPGALMLQTTASSTSCRMFWCAPGSVQRPDLEGGWPDIELYHLRSYYAILDSTASNIRALAAHYVQEIRRVQPQGPYLLGGYCEGARLAFEIAKQLTTRDAQVPILALVELDLPQQDWALPVVRLYFRYLQRVRYHAAQLSALSALRRIVYVIAWIRRCCGRLAPHANPARYLRLANSDRTIRSSPVSVSAEDAHVLEPLKTRALMLYVRGGINGFYRLKRFQKAWRHLCMGGETVRMIDGEAHGTPSWREVAHQVGDFLGRLGYLRTRGKGESLASVRA